MLEYHRIDMPEVINVNKTNVRVSVFFVIAGNFLRLAFSLRYVMVS